ncbi:uncharacterized protein LOC134241546 [Saccostrea cucullata]|uniref:uncharacterized protein LOC134241546 n=1 Tax=Saccostrea cuccullata TaxID=36930 RepID=UPI002ED03A15
MKNTQLQTVQKHLNEINKIISDIKDEINSLEDALESKDISKFCNFKSDLEKYRKLPTNIALSVPKFKPERIEGVLCKLFGFLTPRLITSDGYNHDNYSMKTPQKSPEAGCSWPVKQLLGEPQTIATLHTDKEYIQYHVAYQGDGKIWTCGGNNTIKLYSINQGSLLKSITTKSGLWPYDIAMTKSGHLVYTDYNDRTVNIVKNEKIEEVVRMKNWKPEGVCSASSGGFLVILMSKVKEQSKVVCYHGSKEINSIQFDDLGRPLYSNSKTKYITENRNLDICVSDNQDGQFLRYIDCGLRQPWGLCVDANDNLFVALYEEKQVKKMKHMQ